MTLPTLSQNWLLTTNQSVAGDANLDAGGPSGACNCTRDRRQLLLELVGQMIAGGTSNIGPGGFGAVSAWTCRYSCGGNNGGALAAGTPGDGVNRWVINTDLPWNTTGLNRGWMVLRNANIGTYGIELLIDCRQGSNGDDGGLIHMHVGMVQADGSGWTGGTTSTAPVPPPGVSPFKDYMTLRLNEGWAGFANNIARAWHWNMWQAEDGSMTYIVYFYNNVVTAVWMLGKPTNPATSWTEPQFVAGLRGLNSDGDNASYMNDWYETAELKTWRADRISTADTLNRTALYLTADTFDFLPFNQNFTVANQVSGEYPLGVIGMASRESNFHGRMGELPDIYWGLESIGALPGGSYYPSGGSKLWFQFGAMVFPWDGSTAITT